MTKKNLAYMIIGAICYAAYISVSDIYPLLPHLIGILFLIFHKHYDDEQFYAPMIVILCLFFYEFDKSLVVGIMPCVFFITRLFVVKRLESMLNTNSLFIALYIVAVYLLYMVGATLCNILFKIEIPEYSTIYIYYLFVDCALGLVYHIFSRDS